MDIRELPGILEALLFIAGEPVPVPELCEALLLTRVELEAGLEALSERLLADGRGLRINRHGDSVQLSTRPEYAPYIEKFLQPVKRQSLSQAVMETLSIIAYRQPVTRGDIEAIRGVKCDYSIQMLLNRGLIREAGQRESIGRPTLFVTTDAFLQHFNLETLADLPAEQEEALPEQ
ncbi:MAG: SMC-Scp complex subunit ScpB, partial [Eubacteriales bacterium]|nr:SMC-Scp complex subunit ScpB [Eubacteriales bacterium]